MPSTHQQLTALVRARLSAHERKRYETRLTIAVDRLVTNGLKALADYDAFTQEQVDHIVNKASVAALDQHNWLARLAVEQTGRGVFEDRAAKNMFACEHVTHSMSPMKSVGVIARDDIENVIEVGEPVETDGLAQVRGLSRSRTAPRHRPHPRSARLHRAGGRGIAGMRGGAAAQHRGHRAVVPGPRHR